MTHRTRRILFSFFAVFFILTTPAIILYCQGWRMDWKNRKFVQTGAFYFKTWPKNCQVYINGKFQKKSDFFFGSVFIENLLPKTYSVEIRKDGFLSWEKNLVIEKKQVAEAKNIILFPEKTNFVLLSQEVKTFFISPDEKTIILQEFTSPETISSPKTEKPGWSLKLLELDKNIKSRLISEQDISRTGAELIDLKFSADSQRVLLKLGIKETIRYYLLELNKTPPVLTLLDSVEIGTDDVYFNPKNSQQLFILKSGTLKLLNLANNEKSLSLLENIVALSVSSGDIYYLDALGLLFKTDVSFLKKDRLNADPLIEGIKKETEYKIFAHSPYVFLKEGDLLYELDQNKKILGKLFEPVVGLSFSPDQKKAFYLSNYEIWVLFLEKKEDQPKKEAGNQQFLNRFSEKIGEVSWLTNNYLIFTAGDKIKVAEIDDRDRINIFDLDEKKDILKTFWSSVYRKFLVLSQTNLYLSEKLAP